MVRIGLLMNVSDERRIEQSAENSEMALKVAEAGIQIARSTFFDPLAAQSATETTKLASIDGFYKGGYFLAQLESGFRGAEKWKQWRYDIGVSGNNTASEVTAPLFQVWLSGDNGITGGFENPNNWVSYFVENSFGIVARGTFFTIEDSSGNTMVRAHDEYTGDQRVDKDNPGFTANQDYWVDDKSIAGNDPAIGGTVAFAIETSPMASFSNYTTKTGLAEPVLFQQTLYFTYAGHDVDPGGTDGPRVGPGPEVPESAQATQPCGLQSRRGHRASPRNRLEW